MSLKTVKSISQVYDHIENFSSRHSKAIVSNDKEAIEDFLINIEAAVVYTNASTTFTDEAQFSLGAKLELARKKFM